MKSLTTALLTLAFSLAASNAQAANELVLRYADGHMEHVPMQKVHSSAPGARDAVNRDTVNRNAVNRDTVNRTIDMNAKTYVTGSDASGAEVELDVLQPGTSVWLWCEFTSLTAPAFPLLQSMGEKLTVTFSVTGVAEAQDAWVGVINPRLAGLVGVAVGYDVPADTPSGTLDLNAVIDITNLSLTDNVANASFPVE